MKSSHISKGKMDKKILDEIISLPETFHGSGVACSEVLRQIADLFNGHIDFSIETGCGLTTLLLSQISNNHLVFSINDGNSIEAVKKSNLLKKESVRFIEAPTQKSLPHFKFDNKIDLALLDGPHGYPFPDLEYYFIYPHIKEGGFLIIDDIQIPTINRMYKILKEDKMYDIFKIVNTTAILKRTSCDVFDPYADGWWLQEYNRRRYPCGIKQKIKKLLGK